jgi:hypothetical protein
MACTQKNVIVTLSPERRHTLSESNNIHPEVKTDNFLLCLKI